MTSMYNEGKVMIRPIAFKPLSGRLSSGGERYGSTPLLASRPGSHMTLYSSSSDVRESRAWCGSPQPASLAALPSPGLAGPLHRRHHSALQSKQSFMSVAGSARGGGGGGGGSAHPAGPQPAPAPAPSPSDSGVSELEAGLRDKDLPPLSPHAHQPHASGYCESGEHAGFSATGSWGRGRGGGRSESEERAWERELHRLQAAHESRLRAGAQKAMKLEQLLMMQSYQLQQDKQRLQRDAAASARELQQLRDETQLLRARLEDTEWNLCQKTGEIALLKTQLKDAQNEKTTKGHEYLQLKAECRQLRETLDRKEKEILKLKSEADDKDIVTKRIQIETDRLRSDLVETECQFKRHKENNIREVEKLKAELKELRQELSDISLSGYEGIECGRTQRGIYEICKSSNEYHWNSNDSSLEDAEVQRLNGELPDCSEPCQATAIVDRLKCELDSKETLFDNERRKWSEEKEKVLRYQKQLQLNYVQMFRRSRTLEAEVESLRLELELCHKNVKNLGKLGKTIEL